MHLTKTNPYISFLTQLAISEIQFQIGHSVESPFMKQYFALKSQTLKGITSRLFLKNNV